MRSIKKLILAVSLAALVSGCDKKATSTAMPVANGKNCNDVIISKIEDEPLQCPESSVRIIAVSEFDAPIYSTLLPESEREREVKRPVGPIAAAKIFWRTSAEISDAAWHRWASVADDLGIMDDPDRIYIPEDEFNRIKGDRNIPYSPFMTRAQAFRLSKSYDYAEWLDHYQPGLKRWSSAMLGGFAGGMVDPVTVATLSVGARGILTAIRATTFRGLLKSYISVSKKMSLAGVPAEFIVGSSAMGEPDNLALLGAAVAPWVLSLVLIGAVKIAGRLFRRSQRDHHKEVEEEVKDAHHPL